MIKIKIKVKYHSDIERIKEIIEGDWIDLRASEDVEINSGEYKLISLGISMELPDGCEANIIPRSSTFKSFGILQTNSFGVIDSSYCGDNDVWKFPALAMRDTKIKKGDRICQFRINRTMKTEFPTFRFEEVENLNNKNRGGFGTTGKNNFCNQKETNIECLKNSCENLYDDDGALYCKLK